MEHTRRTGATTESHSSRGVPTADESREELESRAGSFSGSHQSIRVQDGEIETGSSGTVEGHEGLEDQFTSEQTGGKS